MERLSFFACSIQCFKSHGTIMNSFALQSKLLDIRNRNPLVDGIVFCDANADLVSRDMSNISKVRLDHAFARFFRFGRRNERAVVSEL